MTDNEIIKALECCSTYKGKCTDCPAFVKVDRSNCKQVLVGALNIINRQKAEIEKLNNTIKIQGLEICDLTKQSIVCDAGFLQELERAKAEAIKEFGDLAIKTICEKVSAPTPSESYIVEKCNQTIDDLLKNW